MKPIGHRTLSFDRHSGKRISPKISIENDYLPSSWEEFLSLYRINKGIEACPLCDIITLEQQYVIMVSSGEGEIICHYIPLARLKNIVEISGSSSLHDPLTGALRKEHTHTEVEKNLYNFVQSSAPFCLVFIDLDHFKNINDTYGHSTGDEVLSEASRRIKNALRENDSLIRYGGDEFLAILGHSSLSAGIKVAERIISSISTLPIVVNDKKLNMTVSIGITTPERSDTTMSLIDRADEALYKAKRNGRNRIEYI